MNIFFPWPCLQEFMISTKLGNVNISVILHTPTALLLDDSGIRVIMITSYYSG